MSDLIDEAEFSLIAAGDNLRAASAQIATLAIRVRNATLLRQAFEVVALSERLDEVQARLHPLFQARQPG